MTKDVTILLLWPSLFLLKKNIKNCKKYDDYMMNIQNMFVNFGNN